MSIFIYCPLFLTFQSHISAKSNVVNIYAGNDITICAGEILNLDTLNAYITGDVTDGTWFTMGNGTFTPCGIASCTFSIADQYIPGTNDIFNGGVDLMLVSFDPDGPGPLAQSIDVVHITLQSQPPLACVSNINVSLGLNCTQQVVPQMLVTNPSPPYANYIITLIDENGNVIPNNILTSAHLGTLVQFIVGHKCGTNICDGYINVQDKTPPTLQCKNHTVFCNQPTTPQALGLPIPSTATATATGPNSYIVTNLDACSNVVLSYTQTVTNFNCTPTNMMIQRINRTWNANDASGNTTTCFEIIRINALPIDSVDLPLHYDGVTLPALECGGNWPTLPDGHPSPIYTGSPSTGGCTNIDFTYTDTEFDLCGNGFKILRKWTIIEWCTSNVTEYNQIIKIVDTSKPVIQCPAPIILRTDAFECNTGQEILPSLLSVTDCSSVVQTVQILSSPSGIDFSALITYQGSTILVDNLPQGSYTSAYTATDECGNKSSCVSTINVIDDKAPIAVCDVNTKVSLLQNGTARLNASSIDDGSIDNCGISNIKIAKMADACGGSNLVFQDYIDFCCSEVGDTVQVALRVTDYFNNINSCMVNVIVEDKINPFISCPTSFTISCDYSTTWSDLDTLGEIIVNTPNQVSPIIVNGQTVGYDGYYLDNCISTVTSTATVNLTCNQGTISRIFKVTDLNNNTATCTQIITVDDTDAFEWNDIIFPPNIDVVGCLPSDAPPSLTGLPTYTNVGCTQLAANFADQVFYNTEGVCLKILRLWTVIDWCQYNANTGAGAFTKYQTIKLTNTILPVITSSCLDTTFCMYSDNCGEEIFTKILTASDDCTPDSLLAWSWQIDLHKNGTFDKSGITNFINTPLPSGTHLLIYTVKDKCGNTRSCTMQINAVDCKKPSPYCYGAITTVIMPTSGNIAVKAKQFNLGSYDNCTPQSLLSYSFTENKNDSIRIFTCADIINGVSQIINVSMWVFDATGNKERCLSELMLQDNNDVCDDVTSFTNIAGTTFTDFNKPLGKVNLKISSSIIEHNQTVLSDTLGNYQATDLRIGLSVSIKPSKSDIAQNGVTTLDLVKIQRHIIGLEKFDSPYKYLASDADGGRKINVADLVILRKLILGKISNFPSNLKVWTFVPKDFIFDAITQPWFHPDSILIPALEVNQADQHFIAVKRGDVNGSYKPLKSNDSAEPRGAFTLNTKNVQGIGQVTTESAIECYGFQMEFNAPDSISLLDIHPLLADKLDWYWNKGKMKLVCANALPISIPPNSILFKLSKFSNINSDYANEVYFSSDEATPLNVQAVTHMTDDALTPTIELNLQNNNVLITPKDVSLKTNWALYDLQGKKIKSGTTQQSTVIDCKDISLGLYIMHAWNEISTITEKYLLGQ